MARTHDLWLPPLPSLYIPPALLQIEAGASIGGSGGMTYRGGWDRESGYSLENVVRYKGKAYICVEPVPEVPDPLGPGLPVVGDGRYKLPQGVVAKPVGRIASGEEIQGVLTTKSPQFTEEAFSPHGPFRLDVWEMIVKESEVEAAITFSGFPPQGLQSGSIPPRGDYRFMLATDSGKSASGGAEPFFGNFAGGSITIKELIKEYGLTGAVKVGGFRFYILLYGGLYLKSRIGEPEIKEIILPTAYSFTVTGPSIVTGPGNEPPSLDITHWAVLSNA